MKLSEIYSNLQNKARGLKYDNKYTLILLKIIYSNEEQNINFHAFIVWLPKAETK